MKITIDLPETLYMFKNEEEFENEFILNNALMLYKKGKISISLAAKLAGIDIYTFMYFCKQNQILVINTTINEIENEVNFCKTLIL